jgi:hypothetical protein
MTHISKGLSLAAALLLASFVAVPPEATAQSTSSTAAYVYIQIQGAQGSVYGFTASSSGKLSAIAGAPWKPTGLIIGDNKQLLVTMGQDNLHSWTIDSNGAIGGALESNPDTDYGDDCDAGANVGAVMDHTGQYVYVLQQKAGTELCMAYKSFEISNQYSEGVFDGVGETEADPPPGGGGDDLPSILGNESFAYADQYEGAANSILGFQRASSGALALIGTIDPTFPGSAAYTPDHPDASPAGDYVVLQENQNDNTSVTQLGSFSVDSAGNLSSTNTAATMPTSPFNITGTTFSPSGDLFVTWADNPGDNPAGGPGTPNGIAIFNFNGASPLTPYTTLLSGTPIDQVAWDSSNHLYAISTYGNELYVFTVTPTSVTQDAAWPIGAPFKMLVVSE